MKGSLNEFADTLLKLKCERIGECKYRKSRKKITAYIIKNFPYFDGMSNAEVISNYWLPTEITLESTGSETYDLSKSEIGEIRNHLYEVEAYEDMMEDKVKPKVLRFEDGDYSNAVNASDPSVKEKIKKKLKEKKHEELSAKEENRRKHSPEIVDESKEEDPTRLVMMNGIINEV